MPPDPSPAPAGGPDRRAEALLLLLLVAIVGLSLLPSLQGGFVWDDDVNIVGNPMLSPVTAEHVKTLWREPFLKLYIPLTYTVWSGLSLFASRFDAQKAAYVFNPFWFHALNLFLHLLCTLLVYRLAARLTRRGLPAFLAAAFFGLSPVQVEAVAWATELKTLLCAFFVFLALNRQMGFQEGLARGEKGFPVFGDYVLGLVFYCAALLSKPLAVVAPFLLLFINHFLVRLRLRENLTYVLPWLAATVPLALITVMAQPIEGHQQVPPFFHRVLVAGDAAAFYILHALLPTGLCIDYGRTPQAVLASWTGHVAWLLPAGLCALFFLLRRRLFAYLGTLLIFLVGFFPVSGIVPFAFQRISTVTDRYLYLSMLGPALAVALFFRKPRKRAAVAAICAVLACYGALCFFQSQTWKDKNSLYFHALKINPHSAMSLFNLAQAQIQVNRKRIDWLSASMLMDGRDPKMARELAKTLLIYIEGDEQTYIGEFKDPGKLALARASLARGADQLRKGRAQEAVPFFSAAAALRPDLAAAWTNQTAALLMLGKMQDAVPTGKLSRVLSPDDPGAANNYAAALFCAGRTGEALRIWEETLATKPGLTMLVHNLALARRLQGRGAGTANPFGLSIQDPPPLPGYRRYS